MSLLADVCKALQPVNKKIILSPGTSMTPGDQASRSLYYEYTEPPVDFNALLNIYTQNPWVYAAVYLISSTAASVPFSLYTRKARHPLDEGHWLWDIVKQANPWMTFTDLLEYTFLSLELIGNAFWEVVRNENGYIREIYFLDPARMRIIPDAVRYIKGYQYDIGGEQKILFNSDEIIHFKYANPANEYWGLGCLQPIWQQLMLDCQANEYNARFFANDATPGGVITTPRILTDTVYNRLVGKWEDRHRGAKRAFSVAILEDGMDFKPIAVTPQEASFPEMRKSVRDALFVGMGVPPVLAGVPDVANYSTARVAQAIFYDSTIAPKLKKVGTVIDQRLIRPSDPTVLGAFDTSTAPINVIKLSANSRIVARLVQAKLMTLNEARSLLGLPPVVGGDKLPGMEYELEDVTGVPAGRPGPSSNPTPAGTGGGNDSETDGGRPEDYKPSDTKKPEAPASTKPGPSWTPGSAGDVGPGAATGESEDSD
jgi:HK97 family phage portal protein